MSLLKISVGLGAALLLAGCSYFVEKPQPGFGDSYRHMVRQQTYDPAAPQAPTETVGGVDGERAATAVKVYREGKTGPATSKSATK